MCDLNKIKTQIYNLENVLEKTDILVDIPNKNLLKELINNFHNFKDSERNLFLKHLSYNEFINPNNLQFATMKSEQRTLLLEILKNKLK